jgi:hypothetical protein
VLIAHTHALASLPHTPCTAEEVQHVQPSAAVASGAFGVAHARTGAARAAATRELRAWVVDPLCTHVDVAFIDASEALRAYETALSDVKLQHAHARKLEAKGERKAPDAAAARVKLAAMSARIAPAAARVHSKLSLLVAKQEGDTDKWVAKHSKVERRLAEEAHTCVRARALLLRGAADVAACPAVARDPAAADARVCACVCVCVAPPPPSLAPASAPQCV